MGNSCNHEHEEEILFAVRGGEDIAKIYFRAGTVQVRDKRPTHTQNARTIFAQTRVKKRVRKCAFTRICTHFMHVFPFVIHSHNCALCGILLYNRKQNKRQFPQTPLKGYLRRQSNSRYVFPLPCFSIGLYNHITERMKHKFEFSYIWFYKS